MAQENYPQHFKNTKEGQLYIVISEALRLGKETGYKDVNLQGGARMFPIKYIEERSSKFIKPKTGLLWDNQEMFDMEELIAHAKRAQHEISKEQYGVHSAKLIENVLYNRKELERGERGEEESVEQLIKKAEKLDIERAAKKDRKEQEEFEDVSDLEGLEL